MTPALRLACAQYQIDFLPDWPAYEQKIRRLVQDAVDRGANFLLFPEYFSMELASLFEENVYRSLHGQLDAMQSLLADFQTLFGALAKQHGLHILAGTFPVRQADGSYRNRAFLFYPDGRIDWQDKLQMTRFENEQWQIQSGTDLKVLDTVFGKVGVAICYDSEFPLLARRQVEAGANLILVPSCTDTEAGFNRVRIGCQARALENQCFVAQSPTIGTAPWSEAVDINTGRAAIYTPVDYGYPDDGVLVMGEPERPQWVVAELDLAALAEVRAQGQVFNHRDWDGQARF
ncbi:carbon-nitrogen hydrolase family protein [Oceanisphaera sp. KMM 10153]|uniref:carbon-nitrogen hydrolase family protein n=1 Tax=Oceanisphaera submarina TaxID=3390193 RepID=UPI0039757067